MLLEIITLYCVCDEYLKQIQYHDDPHMKRPGSAERREEAQMTTAEVMTCALVAAWFFAGNLRVACAFLHESGAMPTMLSESRFTRRLHRLGTKHWQGVLTQLARQTSTATFIVDSYPVAVCHLQRAARCRLYPDANRAYFGYCAAKKEGYDGLKAPVLVSASGQPREVLLLCGCSADLTGLKEMALEVPKGATLCADRAYTDYGYEDQLQAQRTLTLCALRKRNAKRQHRSEVAEWISKTRKRIETTFSQVTAHLSRRIHAVTAACFESKVMATFVAYAILGVAS